MWKYAYVVWIAASGLILCGFGPVPRQGLGILEWSGKELPMVPGKARALDFSAPTINDRGQAVYGALTSRPTDGGTKQQIGFGVFRQSADNTRAMVLHLDVLAMRPGGRPMLSDAVECAINESGQVGAIGIAPGALPGPGIDPVGAVSVFGRALGGTGQAVFGPGKGEAYRMIVKAGDAAPGVKADQVFEWFDTITIGDDGRVSFRAGLGRRGVPLRSQMDATLSFWTVEAGGEPRNLLMHGEEVAGTPKGELVTAVMMLTALGDGVTLSGMVKGDGDATTDAFRLWHWTEHGGLVGILRAADRLPGLADDETLGVLSVQGGNKEGEILVLASIGPLRRNIYSRSPDLWGVWRRAADGSWQAVVRTGDVLGTGKDELRVGRVDGAMLSGDGVIVALAAAAPDAGSRRIPASTWWRFRNDEAERILVELGRPAGVNIGKAVLRPGPPWGSANGGHLACKMSWGEEKNGRLGMDHSNGVWLLTDGGEQRWIQLDGFSLVYAPERTGKIWRTEFNPRQVVSPKGEVVFKMYVENGDTVVARSQPIE